MSKRLVRELAKRTAATGSDRRVLMAIASRCKRVAGCEQVLMSRVTISSAVGLHPQTVGGAVWRLEHTGALIVTRRKGHPWLFEVVLDKTRRVVSVEKSSRVAAAAEPQHVGVDEGVSPEGEVVSRRAPKSHLNPRKQESLSTPETLVRASPTTDVTLSSTRVVARELPKKFVEAWNANCGGLPRLRRRPHGSSADRLVRMAWGAVDYDAALLGRSIARAAADPHYLEHRFGWETFCRHIDRWLDDDAGKRPSAAVTTSSSPMSPEQRAATERGAAELRRQRREREAALR